MVLISQGQAAAVLQRLAVMEAGVLRRRAVLFLHWQAVVGVRWVRLQFSALVCGLNIAQCSTSARGCGLVPHMNKQKLLMRNGRNTRAAGHFFVFYTHGRPSALDSRDRSPLVHSVAPGGVSVGRSFCR